MVFDRLYNISRRLFLNQFSNNLHSQATRDYWEHTRGLHTGKRGFVIGNGPSLTMDDLTTLKDEITIASNKIYLAFDKTPWRPTYYTIADEIVAKKIAPVVHEHIKTVLAPAAIGSNFPGCDFYTWKGLIAPKIMPQDRTSFSGDARIGFHGGYSITYQNMQLAVHLGLDPIYLIGCDHYYAGENSGKKVGVVTTGEVNNHFIKGYREKGEIVNTAAIDRMDIAYNHAEAWSRAKGVQILNATRGGHLEVFDRISLDTLF